VDKVEEPVPNSLIIYGMHRNMPQECMALEDQVHDRTPVRYRGFYLKTCSVGQV
jgi:hypothetical protein